MSLHVCNQFFLESVHYFILKIGTTIEIYKQRKCKVSFPEKFLFSQKWSERAHNGVFCSFHKILSLIFARSNLTWKTNIKFAVFRHIWENFAWQDIGQNALIQSYSRILWSPKSLEGMHQYVWRFAWRYLHKKGSIIRGYCLCSSVSRQVQECPNLHNL